MLGCTSPGVCTHTKPQQHIVKDASYAACVCLQTLQTEIQNLKDQVQELHRDLTKHHSIINTDKMGEILDRSLHVDSQIAGQYSTVETMRVMFEEVRQVMPDL